MDHIESFPALKIDYIAIQEGHRKMGLGSDILSLIREKALEDEFSATSFIIVEAYDSPSYSSVRFYLKNCFRQSDYGLVKAQNKSREGITGDTCLLYLPLVRQSISQILVYFFCQYWQFL